MKNKYFLPLIVLLIGFNLTAWAQTYNINNAKIEIKGTSTMHDWDMTSSTGRGSAKLTLGSDGKISGIQSVNFSAPATTFKSKTSGLDANAYKALKTGKYPNISYTASSAQATTTDGSNYTIKANGTLNMAGTSKPLELTLKGKLNADKSLTVAGSKVIKLTDWGVEPPSFMFGAMKTGNEITININATLKN